MDTDPDAHPYPIFYTPAHQNTDPDAYTHANLDTDADLDLYTDTRTHRYTPATTHSISIAHTYRNGNVDANTAAGAHRYPFPHIDTGPHGHTGHYCADTRRRLCE